MNLAEAIVKIQYDSSWGVWAEVPFAPDSEARYGQCQFENGGVLDNKELFTDGVSIGDWFKSWFEDCPELKADEKICLEAAARMIEGY